MGDIAVVIEALGNGRDSSLRAYVYWKNLISFFNLKSLWVVCDSLDLQGLDHAQNEVIHGQLLNNESQPLRPVTVVIGSK